MKKPGMFRVIVLSAQQIYNMNPAHYAPAADKAEFTQLYMRLNREEVVRVAHQPQDLIKYCMMGGATEECQAFTNHGGTLVFSSNVGVCYSFNYQGVNRSHLPVRSQVQGTYGGLTLVLDVEGRFRCDHVN